MSKRTDHPAQLTFAVFCPPVVRPNGDGTYTVAPGRPLQKLTAVQLATQFAVDRDTIYRWRQEGLIPDHLVQKAGKRKLLFLAECVDHLQSHFNVIRD